MSNISKSQPLRAMNHIGLAVPDMDAAIEWYTTVLGFRMIRSVVSLDRAEYPDAPMFHVYDERLKKVKLGFLASANGCGLELFEFVEPKMVQPAGFDWTRGGFFHICITDPDPEAVKTNVLKAGGKAIGETVKAFPEEEDIALYLQDPWGNVVEVMSCSIELMMGNRG